MGQRKTCACGRKKPPGRGRHTCGRCQGGSTLPKEERLEIARLYTEEGKSINKIVATRPYWNFGVVQRALRAEKVQMRPVCMVTEFYNALSQDDLDEIAAAYRSGRSPAQLARMFGLSTHGVKHRLRRAGVKIRGCSETQRLARMVELEEQGMDALTPHQRAVLACIEKRRHNGRTEAERAITHWGVVDETGVSILAVKGALRALKRWGLVTSEPGENNNCPALWRRTDLAIVDVLSEYLKPPLLPGKSDVRLPGGPLKDWIADLIAKERRAFLYSAVKDPRDGHDPKNDKHPEAAVRKRLGIDARTFHRLRVESDFVTFGLADRILQNADGPRMEELWPELERELEEAA